VGLVLLWRRTRRGLLIRGARKGWREERRAIYKGSEGMGEA